ncbi:tyrosine-protein phosphatase [Paenisporosarcina sp. TG-14]|uniref:tyrosine-protein phosphatase n=1 Tax=Paenisporosarcina sp. TG-14 TaxID=1231057 RepID=UPI00031786FB|nr:CpsB/CapC family capsule biosynthesis tyrosine phosphatase [Paenisporosarcina sp. TG-14]
MLVDLHNHILPGLDDGPDTELEALLLIQNAVHNGVTHIVATPHHRNGVFNQDINEIKDSIHTLNLLLQEREILVTILPGMEVRLHADLLDELASTTLTIAGSHKYVLIEFPTHHIPQFTESIFYEMQLKGYIPVIAHAEKNEEIRRHPKKLFNLVTKGALVQVTAASVTGANGKDLQRFVLKLCQHNIVHFIASDAHGVHIRPFLIKQAYQVIEHKLGKNFVNYFQQNANHVLNGVEFQVFQPALIGKI